MLTSPRAEKFAKICALNKRLAAKVKDLDATGPVQEGPSRELVAAQQEIEELEEELQIEKRRSAKLEKRRDKCKSEPESTEQTDIAQLQLEKDMLLHQIKNLPSENIGLESELRAFERGI
jgi:chromosome segregation ATPase